MDNWCTASSIQYTHLVVVVHQLWFSVGSLPINVRIGITTSPSGTTTYAHTLTPSLPRTSFTTMDVDGREKLTF